MQMKAVKDLPTIDRPREKIMSHGPHILTNLELLQVIIGSGNKYYSVEKIAWQLDKLLQDQLPSLANLRTIKGINTSKVALLLAIFELGKRYYQQEDRVNLSDVNMLLSQVSHIRDKRQEHLLTLTVDGTRHLIAKRVVTIGTLNTTLIHPREIFADAISDRAAGIYIVHNHPSGNPNPSQEDVQVTQRIIEAGTLLGISLLDHIIVTKKEHYSFHQSQLLEKLA